MANNIFHPKWLHSPLMDHFENEFNNDANLDRQLDEVMKNPARKRRPPPKPDPRDEFDVALEEEFAKPANPNLPSPLPWAGVPQDKLYKTPHQILAAPGYWYLATPYTDYPDGREAAYYHATEVLAGLWAAGVKAFGPISHTHEVSRQNFFGGAAWPHELWMAIDQPMMDAAHGLLIATLDGWDVSKGVQEERKFFAAAGRPCWFLNPLKWEFAEEPNAVA
jgi:hypothetical protein